MLAIAEVIDESVRNMSRNMVTKTDQEKVRLAFLDPIKLKWTSG